MLLYVFLLLISLVGYALVIALSIIPVDPAVASRGQYVVFVVYGVLFYVIATAVHLAVPLLLFDTYFSRRENRWQKRALFALPTLLLLYVAYVIAYGQ
ncbi:MAG TPA: hypothetical protein VM031_01590 [Phycisphaerae bacterium]|nr:hypothetical protein [Phycisphaerae bacterium]